MKSHSNDECAHDEWEAQERALREERRGAIASDNARDAQYRFIARVLRHTPMDPIPHDLSYKTVQRVERLAEAADDRFELGLQRVLIALMAIVGVVTLLFFGGDWVRAFAVPMRQFADLGSQALSSWVPVIATCFGLSWAIEQWSIRMKG